MLALAYRDAGAALARARSDPAHAWREERLNALTAEADRRCGQTVVEPAPAPETVGHAGA